MKTPLLIAAAAMILSAPAVAEAPAQPTLSEPTTFEGWIRVSGEEFQLVPEQSTSAIICHHPDAKYFNVSVMAPGS